MAAPAIVSKMMALRRVRVFLAASPWNRASMMAVRKKRGALVTLNQSLKLPWVEERKAIGRRLNSDRGRRSS
jgi:hypothetical protein